MVGSEESFDYISEPSISDEIKSIPLSLHCFTEYITLSTIWIPSNLLPNRNELQNTQATRGIFHTLEKKESKHNESFSVYATSDDDEIFHSDEEDLLSIDNQNNAECLKNRSENILSGRNHNFSSNENNIDETVPNAGLRKIESYISLHEILDDTPEFNVKAFSSNFRKEDKFSDTQKKTSNQKKSKQKKGKKNVGLDEFLSDYSPQDYQEACCKDYFNSIMAKSHDTENVRIKSTAEFPKLAPNEIKFVHSEKSNTENSLNSLQSFLKTLNTTNETRDAIANESEEAGEEMSSTCVESVNTYRKLVIENIPGQTSKEDVEYLLCGYGEIRSFSLDPVGEFLKATVEINLECDQDNWIIECLNESEPFGASTRKLKCYEQL